jgi:hypothetical protein
VSTEKTENGTPIVGANLPSAKSSTSSRSRNRAKAATAASVQEVETENTSTSVQVQAEDASTSVQTTKADEEATAVRAAPLDPPPLRKAEDAPAEEPISTPEAIGVKIAEFGDGTIIDAATGQPPANPDAVFVKDPSTPRGSRYRSGMRLQKIIGTGRRRTSTLVLALNAELGEAEMLRMVALLKEQADDSDDVPAAG